MGTLYAASSTQSSISFGLLIFLFCFFLTFFFDFLISDFSFFLFCFFVSCVSLFLNFSQHLSRQSDGRSSSYKGDKRNVKTKKMDQKKRKYQPKW